MNDEQLAEAARRLKARTGAGFRRHPLPGGTYVDVDEMLMAELLHAQQQTLGEETARQYQHGDYVDLVQRSDGVWCAPWDLAKRSEDGQREPGCETGAS